MSSRSLKRKSPEQIENEQVERFIAWGKENISSLDFTRSNIPDRKFSSVSTILVWMAWKIQDDKILDLECRLYSAKYILEEFHDDGENGIQMFANASGLPPGVIKSAFDNIFHGIQ